MKNLSVVGKNHVALLKNINVAIELGEYIGVTGTSGAGKTTLIKSIMGVLDETCRITSGDIVLDGESLRKLSAVKHRSLCGTTLGFIPQNPMTAFDRHRKIGKQMEETFKLKLGISRNEAMVLAEETLKKVNLTDVSRIMNSYSSQLSGGMLQRVTVAILWGLKPNYILADEPTSALDENNRNHLLRLLQSYSEKVGVLFLSHDVEALRTLCKQIIVMEKGRIVERNSTEKLFRHPQAEWTKKFVMSANTLEGGGWEWIKS